MLGGLLGAPAVEADHDVAEQPRHAGRQLVALVDRERQHVGDLVASRGTRGSARASARGRRGSIATSASVAPCVVEHAVDERRQRGLVGLLRRAVVDLDGHQRMSPRALGVDCRDRRRRSAARACGGRRPGGRTARTRCPGRPCRISRTSIRPEPWPRGRSICVTSPVTTTCEPKPSRVRNICICSGVVFCASSRMMKRVVQRAAAHERQRRDLDDALLQVLLHAVGVEHVHRGRRTAAAGTGRPWPRCRRAGSRAARPPRPRAASG